MQSLEEYGNNYLAELKKRSSQSRVSKSYQLVGLEIAGMLGDFKNKSLYIKLAKQHGEDKMRRLAKSVLDRKNLKNPAAYFMKVLHSE
ncbi:MAG: hypothetical protein Q8Q37_01115 [bacterium]|nr:hypothetical protein [bacterium]